MSSIDSSPVTIQISSQSIPSMPLWFGEVVAFAQVLEHMGASKRSESMCSLPAPALGNMTPLIRTAASIFDAIGSFTGNFPLASHRALRRFPHAQADQCVCQFQ